jgi:hypothetical protein
VVYKDLVLEPVIPVSRTSLEYMSQHADYRPDGSIALRPQSLVGGVPDRHFRREARQRDTKNIGLPRQANLSYRTPVDLRISEAVCTGGELSGNLPRRGHRSQGDIMIAGILSQHVAGNRTSLL